MCILWSKYYDIKFGGGVKVNTINIKRGEALGLGVSLNQAALSYVIGTDKSDYIAAG